jgi:hypothetical protein
MLGSQWRSKVSIHSDIWEGTAIDLSLRDSIIVYPVTGWRKERHQLGKWDTKARYSLVVSVATPENEVDIYTSIVNKIGIQIPT